MWLLARSCTFHFTYIGLCSCTRAKFRLVGSLMGDSRLRELQIEFALLRQQWAAADSMSERQRLLTQLIELLDESNIVVERTVRGRLMKYSQPTGRPN